jgi:hypothetical protein
MEIEAMKADRAIVWCSVSNLGHLLLRRVSAFTSLAARHISDTPSQGWPGHALALQQRSQGNFTGIVKKRKGTKCSTRQADL